MEQKNIGWKTHSKLLTKTTKVAQRSPSSLGPNIPKCVISPDQVSEITTFKQIAVTVLACLNDIFRYLNKLMIANKLVPGTRELAINSEHCLARCGYGRDKCLIVVTEMSYTPISRNAIKR